MAISDIFSKALIRANLPRCPEDSTMRMYTGSDGSTAVLNDDGSVPLIAVRRRVGDAVRIEDLVDGLDIQSETLTITLITDDPPDTNLQWWYSIDGGTTKNRVNILRRDSGSFGYYYLLLFQVV